MGCGKYRSAWLIASLLLGRSARECIAQEPLLRIDDPLIPMVAAPQTPT